jgi:hypothetical protein
MANSLVKFSSRKGNGQQRLFWDRAGIDGLPFRGANPPMMTEEEFESRAVRVADVRNEFFDMTDDAQRKAYLDVLECCMNGWFRVIHLERFWGGSAKHYIEWAEFYLEDGSRTPYQTAGFTEVANGQQSALYLGPGAGGT